MIIDQAIRSYLRLRSLYGKCWHPEQTFFLSQDKHHFYHDNELFYALGKSEPKVGEYQIEFNCIQKTKRKTLQFNLAASWLTT